MKRIYFLRSHITDNWTDIVVIMLQIVITVVVFNMFWGDFQQLLVCNDIYKSLGLDNVACISVKESGDEIFGLIDEAKEMTLLGENYNPYIFTSDLDADGITVQPISLEYVDKLGGNQIKGVWQVDNAPNGTMSAVVSKKLAKKYRLGNTYALHNTMNDVDIKVYISGVMKDNYTFVPPAYGTSNSIISDISRDIFICCDEQTAENVFGDDVHSSSYTIAAENRASLETFACSIDMQGYMYADVRSAKEYDDYFILLDMGIPMAITVIMLILCIANFASYSMLSAIKREKEFAVYFICGSTWRECLILQLLEDIFVTVVPFVISMFVCGILSVNRASAAMTLQGMLLSAVLCVVVMLASSSAALLRIRKNSPVETIRRLL